MAQGMDLGEIQKWIEDRRTHYEGAVKLIRQALANFHHHSPEGRHMIYRVASRGDYQLSDELKTVQSIKAKLEQKWASGRVLDTILRDGGLREDKVIELLRNNDLDATWLDDMRASKKIFVTETAEGKVYTTTSEVRDKLAKYTIFNMEDVVGCKVVAIYPQHLDPLAKAIKEAIARDVYTVESEEEVVQESGYRGHHFVVRPQLTTYHPFTCEIQLVTMLHETWAFKTHDLTYKGKVKAEYRKEARLLSDALRVIDDQSELLMQKISEKLHTEDQRRDACKKNLFKSLLDKSVAESPDIRPIAEMIQNEMGRLAHGRVDHVLAMLAEYPKVHGHDRHFCRAIGLLAALRRDNDLDSVALHYLDRLVAESPNTAKADGMIFKGLLFYCFDRVEDAISVTRDAIRVADAHSEVLEGFLARQNFAYYIADAEKGQWEVDGRNALQEARALLEGQETLKAEHEKTLADTAGYFEISFGKSLQDVEAGWEKCKKAAEEHPLGVDLPKSYLRIHAIRALSKMLDFMLKQE